MAPVVTRELRITYGSTVAGGTSDYQLDSGDAGTEVMTVNRTFERTEVSFWVLTAGHSTDAELAAACAALESAFTRPRQRLLIQQGPAFASTLLDLNPGATSPASGIEVRAEIAKVGSPHDTGRSRRYLVRVSCQNPADHTAVFAGEAGLRDFAYSVAFLPSRVRTITLTGTYTKLAANNARAQYADQIAARAGALHTALVGTFETVDEQWDIPTIEDSLLSFRLVQEELKLGQSIGVLDDPNVYKQALLVRVGRRAPGDSDGALRLAEVAVTYVAWLDKDNVPSLASWWASTGLPWIASHARSLAGGAGAALVSSDPDFDEQRKLIQATLLFLIPLGGNLLESVVTTIDEDEKGVAIVPAWTGNDLNAYVYKGPRIYHRRTQLRARYLGKVSPPALGGSGARGAQVPFGFDPSALGIFALGQKLSLSFEGPDSAGGSSTAGASGAGPAPGQLGLVLLKETNSWTPLRLGIPGYQLDVTDVTEEKLFRLVAGMPNQGGAAQGRATPGGTHTRQARPPGA